MGEEVASSHEVSFSTAGELEEMENKEKADALKEKVLFPYDTIRNVQHELISDVLTAVTEKKNLVAHAPTGLGKTAAVLAPTVKYALDNKKVVFFLTSRHTQHRIAIETLQAMRAKCGVDIVASDLIGKKWMCAQQGVDLLRSGDFAEYCKKQRDESICEYYVNTKDGTSVTPAAENIIAVLKQRGPLHVEEFKEDMSEEKLCPYEMSTILAKDAQVIVADYYYLFNPSILQRFLVRSELKLEDVIVIVDEAHNLPSRIRDLMTKNLSTVFLKRAIKEADKHHLDEAQVVLSSIGKVLDDISESINMHEERIVMKAEFMKRLEVFTDYDAAIDLLETAADVVRENDKQSSLGAIAAFLESWKGEDDGFVRITQRKIIGNDAATVLAYKCLDPSLVTKDVLDQVHSTIMMSGTLTPTAMYRDLLGLPVGEQTIERIYKNPFPPMNKLNLIIPETTTKFTHRSEAQFTRIGAICAEATNAITGNSAIFFPSYALRDQVYPHFQKASKRTVFREDQQFTQADKHEFLKNFEGYKKTGAVLLGVMGGNFSEGVDFMGDMLKGVIVVGLPLQRPNLETNKVIEYYDTKFGKGWDYGYLFPAFNKTLQAAGRCIRSETDKGVIIYLDERYTWPNYYRCFPPDAQMRITKLYLERINEFFGVDDSAARIG